MQPHKTTSMEKVFIKPIAQEILINSTSQEGRGDTFSYDYNSDEERRLLGNLFIVGNIGPEAADVKKESESDAAYITNLVASLAKREYYADSSLEPRKAFSATLRKINDVIEDFFKNKDAKINIGIFAVAGDQILISRLGKFKIILTREGKNIDILNNINLFNKELIQEKKFSNIISGKINVNDRLFAFYPTRSLLAREKSLKAMLIKSSADDLIQKLNAIKEEKENFACTALYIQINKVKEPAVAPKLQPHELKEMPEAILASQKKEEESAAQKELTIEKTPETNKKEMPQSEPNPVTLPAEPPKIIAAEFALGKKTNPLTNLAKKINLPRFSEIATSNYRRKLGYLAVFAILIGIIISGSFIIKSVFFASPAEKQSAAAIKQAQENLKTAQIKISENDGVSARNLLMASLSSLQSIASDKNSKEIEKEINDALDSIDKATAISPSLVATIPPESGKAKLIGISGNNTYLLLNGEDSKNYFVQLLNGSVANRTELKDLSPSAMFNGPKNIFLLDAVAKKLTLTNTGQTSLKTISIETSSAITSGAYYEDNLYLLLPDSISKISDVSSGKLQIKNWSSDQVLKNNILIAVDGKIYTISSSGLLTTYFKGKKEQEKLTNLTPTPQNILLTTKDSPNLYLIENTLGRIYVIDKTTGTLIKTLKIGNSQPIVSANISSTESVFIITSDNKIWEIKP